MTRFAGLIMVVGFLAPGNLWAEREVTRVAVLPFHAPRGGRVAALTVAQIVVGTLGELESVQVTPLSEVEQQQAELGRSAEGAEVNDEALAALAAKFGYDTVIYGTMVQTTGDRNVVTGCVFDARAGRTLGCKTVDAEDWWVMRLQLNGTLHPWLVQRTPLRVKVAERLDSRAVRLDGGWLDGLGRWQVFDGPGGVKLRVVSLTNETAVAVTVTGAGEAPEAGAVLVRFPVLAEDEEADG